MQLTEVSAACRNLKRQPLLISFGTPAAKARNSKDMSILTDQQYGTLLDIQSSMCVNYIAQVLSEETA